jgi:hypothetical protein
VHTLSSVNNTLNSGPTGLVVTSEITIAGNGATIKRESSAPPFRLFTVTTGNLTLQKVTITGGTGSVAPSGDSVGGGVFNSGVLSIVDSTVSGNLGGGVFNEDSGSGSIINSYVVDNTSCGVDNAGGTLTIANSTVAGNGYCGIASVARTIVTHSIISQNGGDGILAERGTSELTISESIIANNGNVGVFAWGSCAITTSTITRNGDCGVSGFNVSLSVSRSAIIRNKGCGVDNEDSSVGGFAIEETTISDNEGVGINTTGGLSNNNRISGSTITGNSGIGVRKNGGTLTLARTLISGNAAPTGPEIVNTKGNLRINNFNLFGSNGFAGGVTPGATDIVPGPGVQTSDILQPFLANNGGTTLTHRLVAGSLARDAIPVANAGCTGVDQRGVARPQGSGCDIGAVETAKDADWDGDSIVDEQDNCLVVPNPSQTDRNGNGVGDACEHDFAILKMTTPKRITLVDTKPNLQILSVQVQNQSPRKEIIADARTLNLLVGVDLEPLTGSCPHLVAMLLPDRLPVFPLSLKPKQKLTLFYKAIFSTACIPDPAKSTANVFHGDYRLSASVNHDAIDGQVDSDPPDDVCPRTANRIDPGPDGTLKDIGCGGKKADGALGAELVVDVVDKR